MRTGIIARKIGMTRVFNDVGLHVPITVLAVEKCLVVDHKTEEKNGYQALVVGSGRAKASRVTKPLAGFFKKQGLEAVQRLKEFRVSDVNVLPVGTEIPAAHFNVGAKVDITGESIGKGFAGVMKRHNFGGLRASHGVSVSHRSHGSTGQRQDPGKVFKGKKMAGHMGSVTVTKQNLIVSGIDQERNLIYIVGAVPGPKQGIVYVRDAIKSLAVS